MTDRVFGERSKRRKRFLLFPVLATAALALFWVAGAQAVHDLEFQLDGDVSASTTTTVGGSTQLIDWDSLFNSAGGTITPLPANFSNAELTKDFVGTGPAFVNSDTTTFATGSKDTLPIADWQCNFDNNVNNKIDVMNAYAASYTDPASGDDLIYFALERFTNTGDANVGFWFLQGPVDCSSTGGAADFSGGHQDGDLLVVSEFSNGGTVSTINVYRWDGDDATGSLNTTPVATGVDCRDPATGVDDDACAAANTAPVTTPWLTAAFTASPKVGHTLPTAQFFEGGLNLSDVGLGDTCFNTFIGDTRSSTSLTATLFDYARGQLGACESEISSEQDWLPNDTATVDVTGIATWGGTVSFELFEDSTDCSGGASVFTDSDTVSNSDPDAATDNSSFVATESHTYEWKVEFTPDAASAAAGVAPAAHCEKTVLEITN